MRLERVILQKIKDNGNVASLDDLIEIQYEYGTSLSKSELKSCVNHLIKSKKIVQAWINPKTKTIQKEKDYEHPVFGYAVTPSKIDASKLMN